MVFNEVGFGPGIWGDWCLRFGVVGWVLDLVEAYGMGLGFGYNGRWKSSGVSLDAIGFRVRF